MRRTRHQLKIQYNACYIGGIGILNIKRIRKTKNIALVNLIGVK